MNQQSSLLLALSYQQNKFRHIADKYKYEDFVRVEIVDKDRGLNLNMENMCSNY
jgi:hypothetical protein